MATPAEARFAEAMDGAYPALAELRSRGVVGAIGVGVSNWQVCQRFAEAGEFDCMMLAGGYTLLKQDSVPFLDDCVTRGISVLVAAPFNTGILATGAVEGARYHYKPATPEVLEQTRRIEAVCRRHDVTLPAAALQFPLRHPAVAGVVVGHQSAEEVDRNLALLRQDIPEALWAELAAERPFAKCYWRGRSTAVLSASGAHGPMSAALPSSETTASRLTPAHSQTIPRGPQLSRRLRPLRGSPRRYRYGGWSAGLRRRRVLRDRGDHDVPVGRVQLVPAAVDPHQPGARHDGGEGGAVFDREDRGRRCRG